jgi:uncharacterized membrane protein
MRTIFILSFLANVVLVLLSVIILPERVAVHFGPDGVPDHWAPNLVNAVILLGVNGLLFLLLCFSPKLIFIVPARLITLPGKRYWLAPENRDRTRAILATQMHRFGAALFLFLFVVGLLTLKANLSDPVRLDLGVFLFFLVVFLAYTVWWCIDFCRSFRVPREERADAGGTQEP